MAGGRDSYRHRLVAGRCGARAVARAEAERIREQQARTASSLRTQPQVQVVDGASISTATFTRSPSRRHEDDPARCRHRPPANWFQHRRPPASSPRPAPRPARRDRRQEGAVSFHSRTHWRGPPSRQRRRSWPRGNWWRRPKTFTSQETPGGPAVLGTSIAQFAQGVACASLGCSSRSVEVTT